MIFSWVDQTSILKLMTDDTLYRETEAWQSNGTLTTATFSVTQHRYCLTHRRSTQPTLELERSEIHRKQKSNIICRIWSGPPAWKVDEVRSTVATGSNKLGVAVGPRQFIEDQPLAKADVIRAMHERVGQRSLERLFPGRTENSTEQATLSAGQSGIGYKRARDIAGPAHLGALIAAKPRILAMIHDAVTAGLHPKQPLVTRLGVVIEAATSPDLEALDGEEKGTAKLYIQKAAQAADKA